MKEIRTIFINNKIDWNAPIIFLHKEDVILDSQIIIEKFFKLIKTKIF